MEGHALDWQNQPYPFKRYRDVKKISLPEVRDLNSFELPFFPLCNQTKTMSHADLELDIRTLARILILTESVTAKGRGGGMDFYFRSAASAGALYPTEIYLASNGLRGLEDGIYHFSVAEQALALIREGRFPNHGGNGSLGLTFFFTAVFFRSSWKYRNRAYRYNLLDTGHVIENHILALKALDIPHRILYDFEDDKINLLLGLDDTKEVALAVVDVPGTMSFTLTDSMKEMAPLPSHIAEASKVATLEKSYDLIREFHLSCLEVNTFSSVNMAENIRLQFKGLAEIPQTEEKTIPMGYPEVLFQRRSKRNFVKRPIGPFALKSISAVLSAEIDPFLAIGMIVGDGEALRTGLYLLDQTGKVLTVSGGNLIETMADICLHQMWLAGASVHFLFMSNTDLLDREAGSRGYRYAMMSAGRCGQRIYLAATALGLGCCGIGAFYDREAAELLGLDEKSRMLYLVAVGSIKR